MVDNLSSNFTIAVDLTTLDPWKGTFVVPEPGLWRFTFSALVYIPTAGAAGLVQLNVDGSPAASAYIYPYGDTHGEFMISLNTLQQLNAGQSVSIVWNDLHDNGAWLVGNSYQYNHFTGQYIGSGILIIHFYCRRSRKVNI